MLSMLFLRWVHKIRQYEMIDKLNLKKFSNAIDNAFESEDGSDADDILDDSKTIGGKMQNSR